MTRVKYATLLLTCALLAHLALACGDGAEEEPPGSYDPELLESYRAAIPDESVLRAAAPANMGSAESGLREQALLGQPATYPMQAGPLVAGVNGSVRDITQILKMVTDTPPTLFNSKTKEFLWGPYPDDDNVGFFGAYIKENPPGEDFAYSYAIFRSASQDLSELTPFVWGGANPDDDKDSDLGSGLTLWDFEANAAFEEEHNPKHGDLTRGRFAVVYARENEPERGDKVTFVLASFRGFIPEDKADEGPIDLDYFYGQVDGAEHTFRFLNYQFEIDVFDGDEDPENDGEQATEAELLDIQLVFLDDGVGRAEALAVGGDLEGDNALGVVECWDDTIAQRYAGYALFGADGEALWSHQDGDPNDCGPLFKNSLDELNIPTLDDIDPELREGLDAVATNGIGEE